MDTVPIQSPYDLQFGYGNSPIQQDLTRLVTNTVHTKGYDVTFTIIGESHLVEIHQQGKLIASEILACVNLDGETLIESKGFTPETTRHHYNCGGYTFELTFESGTFEDPPCSSQSTHLYYPFPNPRQEDGPKPYTFVEWEISNRLLEWRTIHIYTMEGGSIIRVITRSEFSFQGEYT